MVSERLITLLMGTHLISGRARIPTQIFLTPESGEFTVGEGVLNQEPVGL